MSEKFKIIPIQPAKMKEPQATRSSCCGGHDAENNKQVYIDPVCGMTVNANATKSAEYKDQTFYFCCGARLPKVK